MGGAPISVTLYKNGITITYGSVPFVTEPALEREMARAFDAGENVEALLWNGSLARILESVTMAIDCVYAVDRRSETFDGTPGRLPPPPPPPKSKKRRKKK